MLTSVRPQSHRIRPIVFACFTALVLCVPCARPAHSLSGESGPEASAPRLKAADRGASIAESTERVEQALTRLPMVFEPNVGQTDGRARFVSRGAGYAMFVTDSETAFKLSTSSGDAADPGEVAVLRIGYERADANVLWTAEGKVESQSNYFIGNDPAGWRTGVDHYTRIRGEGVWPGVDVVYYGNRSQLEYDFVVAPGANVDAIQLKIDGAELVRTDDNGDLILTVAGRDIRQRRPVLYQTTHDGERQPVPGRYMLDGHRVRFAVGAYDRALSLVIDPVLEYSSIFGGSISTQTLANEETRRITVDSTGAAYIAAATLGADFPTTMGSYDTLHNGGFDVYVTKLNPAGSALVFSTFIGGASADHARGIAVNPAGEVFIAGRTFDNGVDYPTTPGAFSTTHNGNWDAFVTKLDATGSSLVYSTFLGALSQDEAYDIALDSTGLPVVVGFTRDTAVDFPTTAGAFDTTHNGGDDVFVTKLNSTGTGLVFSTFLGGSSTDEPRAVVLDSTNRVYVTGFTMDAGTDLQTTVGAFDTTHNGLQDAFATCLSATASSLVFSTFLGGSGNDIGNAIAVDSTNRVYVTGATADAATDYPTTGGAFSTTHAGARDAFVSRLDSSGAALGYSTFLGGTLNDDGFGIGVDSSNQAYVTGQTEDTFATDFPTTAGAFNTVHNGQMDIFVTKLNAAGSALAYSTYIGGTANDSASGIFVDASGVVYLTGTTTKNLFTNYPTTAGAFDTVFDGDPGELDAVVTKLNASGTALVYSTYIGGDLNPSFDEGVEMAVDATGAVYIAGRTSSIDFPVTGGAFDTTNAGNQDVHVTKLNPAGNAIVYSTFLGGDSPDIARGIAVDASGQAYVTGIANFGFTASFPTTAGSFQPAMNGPSDAFVTKLNATGSALIYSTFLGGSGVDDGGAIAVNASGQAYVTGTTEDSTTDFPTTAGVFSTTNAGGFDVFVARLNAAGSGLVWSTMIGGPSTDTPTAIFVDGTGQVYVGGFSMDAATDFPTTAGAFATTNAGGEDAILFKLNATASALLYSTLIGGSGNDRIFDITVDSSGQAYTTGFSLNAVTDFPVTPGAFKTAPVGQSEAFVTKFNATATALVYSTFLGGASDDLGRGIAVDSLGRANVTGNTRPGPPNLPTTPDAFDATHNGQFDMFYVKLDPTGNSLVYSTFMGGPGDDVGWDLDMLGTDVYIVGSMQRGFPLLGSVQSVEAGEQDVFAVKFSDCGIVCPANVTVPNDTNACSAVVNYTPPTVDPSCGTVTCAPMPGTAFPVGTTTVTCDLAGTMMCTFTVTVNDTQGPTLTCPSNMSVSAALGQCSAAVSFTTPTAMDNCMGVGSVTCMPMSGSTFSVGTTTVTCSAMDAAGNPGQCTFTVTVTDTQAPTLSCPANIAVSNAAGMCSAVVTYTTPTATDNCPGATVSCMPASGLAFAVGTTTVTCTATDTAGLMTTCTFTITVADAEAPAIVCPANISIPNTPGMCTGVATFTATATDNCPGIGLIVCSPASGTGFPIGTTTVGCTVSDAAGNPSSCSFTVTVMDTEPPTITCPANMTIPADAGQCSAMATYAPTATDNCPGVTVVCTPASGSTFTLGATTVSCTATDASANTATCAFTVTVTDTQPPVVTCPANISTGTDPNQCSAVVPFTAPATDNCPGAGVVCVPPTGTAFVVGTTTVTCTATDSSSNTSVCSFTVTVADNQAPSITCPANQIVSNDMDACSATVSFSAPTVADNCPGLGSPSCTPPSGSSFGVGTTTVTCSVTDAAANTSTCSFTVTVNDNQAPTLACPSNITTPADPGQCSVAVKYKVGVTENCPGVVGPTCVPASGSTFNVGTTTVNCTASDAAGNTATCAFTVTVADTQPPSVTCPANITALENPIGSGGAVVIFTATASDNCPSVSLVCTPSSGAVFPVGTTTVTCTATDTSGNMASCQFTVTVITCTISCPANIVTGTTPGVCGAVVNYPGPTTTGGCGTVTCLPAPGSTFPLGVTTVVCTTTAGPSCSFTISVSDTQPPTVVCPPNVTATGTLATNCALTAVVTYPAPTVSDNCPGATVLCVPPSGTTFTEGVTTVVCTATDAAMNVSSCQFTVTVGAGFGFCAIDDTTGDTFQIVTNTASPLYGYWRYRIAATNTVLCGLANFVSSVPNVKLRAYDNDYSPENPVYFMDATFGPTSGTVYIRRKNGTIVAVLRDRNLLNNPPCQ